MNCLYCKKEFESKRIAHRFCSTLCRHNYTNEQAPRENKNRECSECGAKYVLKKFQRDCGLCLSCKTMFSKKPLKIKDYPTTSREDEIAMINKFLEERAS